MKVLAINSSPNKEKGNTALVLGPFLEGMKEAGAEVELYYTRDLKVSPCMGERACQLRTAGRCIQDDDMTWLLPKVAQADAWVWATPLYGSGMTGTLKVLMDRMLPLADASMEIRDGRLRHPPAAGRKKAKVVLVSTCGLPEIENFDPLLAHVKEKCANSDSEFIGALLRPAGPAMATMLKKGAPIGDILEAARDAGRQLARNGSISGETLGIISRPIISKEAMMQIVNQNVQNAEKNIIPAEQKSIVSPAPANVSAKRKEPSRLAERVAIIRAGESRKPEDERICYDPYAVRFINPIFLGFAQRYPDIFTKGIEQSERFLPGVGNSVAARVRYFDEVVITSLAKGLEQLVVLGAGYDSRAYRIEGLKKIRVFEVDHPSTLDMKTAKVKEIFGALPGHVTYVPVDFDKESLGSRLFDHGYDPAKKTLFTLEGLIYYIDPESVDGTLGFIARNSGKGSAVVFDYYPRSVIDGTYDDISGKNTRRHAQALGEPLKFGIDGPVEAFLAKRGFTKVESVTSEDFKKRYFHGKNADREVSSIYSFAYAVVE